MTITGNYFAIFFFAKKIIIGPIKILNTQRTLHNVHIYLRFKILQYILVATFKNIQSNLNQI